MNDIKLLGRLTADPELKRSGSGTDYANFTIAVNRQNDRDEADFIRCVVFGKLAQAMAQHCKKGRQILCEGRLQVSSVVDQQTQKTNYYHTVVANSVHFLHDPSRNVQNQNYMQGQNYVQNQMPQSPMGQGMPPMQPQMQQAPSSFPTN